MGTSGKFFGQRVGDDESFCSLGSSAFDARSNAFAVKFHLTCWSVKKRILITSWIFLLPWMRPGSTTINQSPRNNQISGSTWTRRLRGRHVSPIGRQDHGICILGFEEDTDGRLSSKG